MYLVKFGHMAISYEHLILTEDEKEEPPPRKLPPGVFRMTVETGRIIDLKGGQADLARAHLCKVVAPPPDGSKTPLIGHPMNAGKPRGRKRKRVDGEEGG